MGVLQGVSYYTWSSIRITLFRLATGYNFVLKAQPQLTNSGAVTSGYSCCALKGIIHVDGCEQCLLVRCMGAALSSFLEKLGLRHKPITCHCAAEIANITQWQLSA